jgi:hypothetical protein
MYCIYVINIKLKKSLDFCYFKITKAFFYKKSNGFKKYNTDQQTVFLVGCSKDKPSMAVPVLVPHIYEALLIVFLHYGPVDSLKLIQCLVGSTEPEFVNV